jgi:hypothetical protein
MRQQKKYPYGSNGVANMVYKLGVLGYQSVRVKSKRRIR